MVCMSAKAMSPNAKSTTPIPLAERRTQKERKQAAETAIIRAAVTIIATKGLGGLTLAAAGEMAGYSRGIASHHFGKKDDLLIAIVNHITSTFSRLLAQDSNIKPGMPMLLRVIDRYLGDMEEQSQYVCALQLIMTEAVSNPTIRPALEKVNERSVQGLVVHIRRAIVDGEIAIVVDANTQALLLLTNLRGLLGHYLVNPKGFNLAVVRRELIKNLKRNLGAT